MLCCCYEVVLDWVCVHGQDALAQEGNVLVGEVDEVDAALQVLLEGDLFCSRVTIGKFLCAREEVACNVVAGEESVAAVDGSVDASGYLGIDLGARQVGQLVDPRVNARRNLIVYMSLLAIDTYLHIVEVVLLALLELGVVAFLLELLGLEVVAGVVLVGDGQWYYVEVSEALDGCAFATHGQHLEDGVLCAVVGVLGASLALRNPDVVFFVVDGMVDVTAHELAALEQFAWAEAASYDEGFVHADERPDPGVDEQVVADGYLDGFLEIVFDEGHVEQGTVEDDVAVVAHVGVACLTLLDGIVTKGEVGGCLLHDLLDDTFHDAYLELRRGVDAEEE